MDTIDATAQVGTDPSVRGGKPIIQGTSITVADVAICKVFRMLSAEEIAEWYDLSLPQVYLALAYYYEHKDEIDRSIADRRTLAASLNEQRFGSKHPPLFG